MTPTGQLALELGTQQAAERAEFWTLRARTIIEHNAHGSFTADDLTNEIGMPPGSRNAVGALFHQLAKEGRIEAVGWEVSSRPERRGAVNRVWRVR